MWCVTSLLALTVSDLVLYAVMYIPAVPYTPQNAAYVERQRESFIAGIPPPDFPRTQGEHTFVGVAKPEDIESPVGKKAMGFAITVS